MRTLNHKIKNIATYNYSAICDYFIIQLSILLRHDIYIFSIKDYLGHNLWRFKQLNLSFCAARRRAAAKKRKLKNLGKSKSTDTEEEEGEDGEDDGELYLVNLVFSCAEYSLFLVHFFYISRWFFFRIFERTWVQVVRIYVIFLVVRTYVISTNDFLWKLEVIKK